MELFSAAMDKHPQHAHATVNTQIETQKKTDPNKLKHTIIGEIKMNNKKIDKLHNLLKLAIESKGKHDSVDLPPYQSNYFNIFMDDLKENNNTPTPYDQFSEKLGKGFNIESDLSAKKEFESVNKIWGAWVYLFNELKAKDLINDQKL